MYGQTKRILALVMALSILASICGMTVSAQDTAGTLVLDQTTVVTSIGDYAYLAFTPAETGIYAFYSAASVDTHGAIYDAQMNLLRSDDDNGGDYNFRVTYTLEAGQTYYLGAKELNGAVGVEIPVRIERSPIARVEFAAVEIIENTQGYTTNNGQVDLWYYQWSDRINYTVYFTDGSSQSFQGDYFDYNGVRYTLHESDSQQDTPWTVGNTYYPTVTVAGIEATVAVRIVETPVASVSVSPVSIMENTRCYTTHGYNANDEWVEYTEYHWYTEVVADVTLKNGETIHLSGNNFDYNGQNYNLQYAIGQSAAAPWTKDNTYTVEFSVLGYPCQTTVTIEGSPVVRVEAQPVVLTEHMGGYWSEGYNYNTDAYETYYYYHWTNHLNYTVYFKDGTSQQVSGGGFYYNDAYQGVTTYGGQSVVNPWLVDNTYEVEFSVMGCRATASVSVEPSPIMGITVDPVVLAENTCGYESGYWDENDQYYEYFRYYWWYQMTGTVQLRDGSTMPFSGTYFTYNDTYYSLNYDDPQSGSSPWVAGNTYTATVTCAGLTAQAEVTIARSHASGDYTYIQSGGNVIITGYTGSDKVLNIPQTLDGKTVTGVMALGEQLCDVEELSIPDSVTMIGLEIFDYAEQMKKLHLGAGVQNINTADTWAMTKLETITVSASNPYLTAVDGVVYDKAVTTLKAYPQNKQNTHVIPDSVTDISEIFDEWGTYWGANVQTGAGTPEYKTVDGVVYNKDMTMVYSVSKEKTTYVMPDSVTDIGRLAFAKSNLETVTISPNVTEIAYGTFLLSKVKYVSIPASVNYIGPLAFDECYQEMTLDVASVEAWCAVMVDDVPDGGWNLAVKGEKVTDLVIPNVVEVIYRSAFRNAKLKSVTIPASVKEIQYYAFAYSSVETVNFSEGLEYLGYAAFRETNVKQVKLPNSLTYMDEGRQFEGCAQLEKVTFGTGLGYIGYNAFAGTAITELYLPENITYIDEEAFQYCMNLRKLTVRAPELYIGYRAFYDCPIENMDLGYGDLFIGDRAFVGNEAISLVLPASVTQIGYRSFEYSTNLVGVVIPESVTYINPLGFYGSTNIKHVYYGGTQAQWDAIEGGCHELNNGTLHLEAGAEDFIVKYTCTRMEHYCRICGTWDYVEYDEPRHNMLNGVCTFCGEGEAPSRDGWVEENGRWTYYKHGVKVVDGWVSDGGWYYMDANGYMAVNRWVKDSTGWCYVGADGKMVFEKWVKDGTGWCYVDKSGYMVYNQWIKDSKGWCYVGKSGYMVYNQWIRDSIGWCYVDGSGYMVFNQWVKDSKGWCYVDKAGYMVYNQWIKDSKGWCYVDKSGYMVYNQWVKDSKGWCYVDKSGYMAYNQWIKDGGSWYYVDGSGYMLANTSRRIGNKTYNFNASGACTNP